METFGSNPLWGTFRVNKHTSRLASNRGSNPLRATYKCVVEQRKLYASKIIKMRGRAAVAHKAHNLEVAGSSPVYASKWCVRLAEDPLGDQDNILTDNDIGSNPLHTTDLFVHE